MSFCVFKRFSLYYVLAFARVVCLPQCIVTVLAFGVAPGFEQKKHRPFTLLGPAPNPESSVPLTKAKGASVWSSAWCYKR